MYGTLMPDATCTPSNAKHPQKDNLDYCKDCGIRVSEPKLG